MNAKRTLLKDAIQSAFEIESTTSVYSGLLRMADHRPVFSRLSPPLRRICRYIPFSTLRGGVEKVTGVTQFIKPEFIHGLSESCEVES